MANELDEMNGPVNEQGRDVNVIDKQVPAKVGIGSTIFEIMLWVLLIIPGIVFLVKKIKAKNYLRDLQQKIQAYASTIDNFLEQRVQVLQNAASLLNKAIALDKDTMTGIAALRSGNGAVAKGDGSANEIQSQIDNVANKINIAFESYPDLEAHKTIADAMQKNMTLQREITAAREAYNDAVRKWNGLIFQWPVYNIVAARAGYTTRVPFTASKETKAKAREDFFN